ncbi:MAG: hypothetical protein ABI597_13375 [Gammaproteobacteria bacterium]
MLSNFLKSLGLGMAVTGAVNDFLDPAEFSIYYNSAISIVGFFSWAVGTYLDCRAARNADAPSFFPRDSTEFIKTGIRYTAGLCTISGATHLIKQQGNNSAGVSELFAGAVALPTAIYEFNLIQKYHSRKLKWEKLRFAILSVADYFVGAGFTKMLNHEPLDLFSIISIPLGFAMIIAEGVYTIMNDVKPVKSTGSEEEDKKIAKKNLIAALNKRSIKLTIALGTIFLVQDIIAGHTDKHSINSDVYMVISNIFLFAALAQMRRLATIEKLREASSELDLSGDSVIIIDGEVAAVIRSNTGEYTIASPTVSPTDPDDLRVQLLPSNS